MSTIHTLIIAIISCFSINLIAQCPSADGTNSGDAIAATLTFDFNDCISNTITGTNVDYTEFTASSSVDDPCIQVGVEGGHLYRNEPTANPHSCTPGIGDSAGMCVGYDTNCLYTPGSDAAVRFDITIDPITGPSMLEALSFYELAPFNFSYIGGISGPNNYPTRYAVRVLVNGTEVFHEIDQFTTQEWSLESFDFTDNPAFTITEETTFNFELTAYCAAGEIADIAVWDLDEISILTSHCQNGFDGNGGTGSNGNIAFEVNEENCTGLTYSFTNNSENVDNLIWYFDWPNLTPSSTEQNPSVTYLEEGNYTVHLEADNGECSAAPFEVQIAAYENGLTGGMELTVLQCDGENVQLELSNNILDIDGTTVQDIVWTVAVNDGQELTFTEQTVLLELNENDFLDIDLFGTGSTGCTLNDIQENISIFDLAHPNVDFDATLTACTDDGFNISISDNSDHGNNVVSSYNWTITADGTTTTYDTESINIVSEADLFEVEFFVNYTNGCASQTTNTTVSVYDELVPNLDITISGTSIGTEGGCISSDNQTLELMATGGSIDGNIISVSWSVDQNGVITTYEGSPVDIGSDITEQAIVTVIVTFDNGCVFENSETFDLGGGTGSNNGEPEFGYVVDECGAENYTVTLSPPTVNFTVTSADWIIVINGDTILSNELNPTLQIPNNGFATVSGTVYGDSGCTYSFGPSILGDGGIPEGNDNNNLTPDFDIVVSVPGDNTGGNGSGGNGEDCELTTGQTLEILELYSVINGTIENVDWIVVVDGETFNYQGNPVDINGLVGDANITATVTYSNGCVFSYNEEIALDGGFINGSIGFSVAECIEEGFIVDLSLPTFPDGYEIESVSWTFDDNGSITNSTDLMPQIQVATNGTVTVNGVVTFTNGCTYDLPNTVLGEGGEPGGNDNNNLTPDFEIVIISGGNPGDGSDNGDPDCVLIPQGQVIQINETNSVIDGSIESVEWIITLNGESFPFEGNPVDIGGLIGEATITTVITYSNGCVFEYTQDLELPGGNGVDFEYEVTGCEDDGSVNVTLAPPSNLPEEFEIDSISWNININGVESVSNEINPQINIPVDGSAIIQTTIYFSNGCTVTTNTQTLNESDLVPEISISGQLADGVECGDDPLLYVFTVSPSATEVSWTYMQGGEIINANGNPIQIELTPGETIDISATATFFDNCISSTTQEFTASDGDDSLLPTFNGDPVIDCDGDETSLILDGNPNWNYTWEPTDGLSFNDNINFSDPIVSVTEITTYNVTVTDGSCVSTGSVIVVPEALAIPNIIIGGDGTGLFCDGLVELTIDNAINGVNYIWSTDPNFENIIGEGSTLQWDVDQSGPITVYAIIDGAQNANCDVSSSTEIINGTINLGQDDPLVLCPGDTIAYEIPNNYPDQEITLVWEDHPNLISVDENGVPTVGAGTDDFSINFTASNQYGCTSDEVLNVQIGENQQLSFTFDLVECGETALIFTASGMGQDSILNWDFGDGQTSTEFMPTNVYDSIGTYTVTLEDLSSICPGISASMDITVPSLPEVIIGIGEDTLISENNPVELSATSGSVLDSISWCNAMGEVIGTGANISYEVDSLETVFAKVVDQYGCSDTTSVVVIIDTIIVEPPLCDSLIISGPAEPFGPCAGQEFNLEVNTSIIAGSDFTYVWGPEECIVSGQGESVITVSVDAEPKVFTVQLVDNAEICIDTINLTYEVDPITIEIDITKEGNDPLILGDSCTITVNGIVEGDDILWNTGETTPSIIVYPNNDLNEYSVVVTDENGCQGEASILKPFVTPPCTVPEGIFIPNAFSPNQDGNNDVFLVRSHIIQPENYEFFVYDRWGEEIFRSTGIGNGWDGTLNGERLSPDVYAYCLKATCIDGTEINHSGNVSLIK